MHACHAHFLRRPVVIAMLFAGALSVGATAQAQTSRPIGGDARPAQQEQQQQQQKPDKQFPIGWSWTAVSLNGKPLTGAERPTLLVDEHYRARGFSGCNTYSATAYPLQKQGFAVGPVASTRKSCEKPLMDQENAFLRALRTSGQWDLVEGAFVLKGDAGELRFERNF